MALDGVPLPGNPVYFQKTYWLAPQDEQYAKPYVLLVQATFVMRGREYLTAIRADDGVLALEALYFADEIRNPAEQLDTLPHHEGAGARSWIWPRR